MAFQYLPLINALVANGALLLCTAIGVMAIMLAEYRTAPGRRQRVGFGLRPVADLIKLASKRSPQAAAGTGGTWAGPLLLAISFTALAVVPFCQSDGRLWTALAAWGGHTSLGVVYVMALSFIALQVGLIAGTRAQTGGFRDFGGMRLVARQLSCYLALGVAVFGVITAGGTARFDQVIVAQAAIAGNAIPAWNLMLQPLGFVVCMAALLQLISWRPLTQRDPTRGGRLDSLYSGRHLALMLVAERVHLIAASAFIVTLYLGGWHIPGLVGDGEAPHVQAIATVIKTAAVVLLFLWVRSSLPSLVIERAATVGWKYLLPLAIANLLLVALGSRFLKMITAA